MDLRRLGIGVLLSLAALIMVAVGWSTVTTDASDLGSAEVSYDTKNLGSEIHSYYLDNYWETVYTAEVKWVTPPVWDSFSYIGTGCTDMPRCWLRGSEVTYLNVYEPGCYEWEARGSRYGWYRLIYVVDPPVSYTGLMSPATNATHSFCSYPANIAIVVMPCYDANLDSKVDISDIYAAVNNFGLTSASPGWNYLADYNEDLVGSIGDVYRVASQFGLDCTEFTGN